MNPYLLLTLYTAGIALASFRLGMLWRQKRAQDAIDAQARLHERARREVEIRAFRDGVTKAAMLDEDLRHG